MTLPLCSRGPDKEPRACGGRRLACVCLAYCIEDITVPYGSPAKEVDSDQTGSYLEPQMALLSPFHAQNLRPKVWLALECAAPPQWMGDQLELNSCPRRLYLLLWAKRSQCFPSGPQAFLIPC